MTHSNVMARPVRAIALNIVLMQMNRSGRAKDGGGAAEEFDPSANWYKRWILHVTAWGDGEQAVLGRCG